LRLAESADARFARGEPIGTLHGLPWAFKDLEPPSDFLGTRFEHLPQRSSDERFVLVQRLRQAACCLSARPIPGIRMGSQTYNAVYGTTVNPTTSKDRCGSSGGAAASVAAGMLPGGRRQRSWRFATQSANSTMCVGFRRPWDCSHGAGYDAFLGFAVKGPSRVRCPM